MLVIDDKIVRSTNMSEEALRTEIAVALYEKKILSFGQARKLAKMGYFDFEKLLFERDIPSGYLPEDLDADMATLKEFREK